MKQDPAKSSAASSPDPGASLRGKAISGGLWTTFAFGSGQLLRLVTNVLLAQVLFPQDFGLMGLVFIVLAGLTMFSDLGIGPAVIQNRREDARFLHTAWTLQVGRGFVIWAVAALLARPFAWLMNAPELGRLLPVVGVVAALQGLRSTKWFTANRDLNVRAIMLVELATSLVLAGVMVAWAYGVDASVWALVYGGIASMLVQTLLSHLLPGPVDRLRFDRAAAGELFHFGKWLFLSTILTFCAARFDKLLLARFTSTQTFGVFYTGQQLSQLGPVLGGRLSQMIGFPALAVVHRERPRDLSAVFLKLQWAVIVPVHGLLVAMVLLGPSLFYVFYPLEYWGAGWIVQVLAIASLAGTINGSYGRAYLATGTTLSNMVAVAAELLLVVASVCTGFLLGGETGFLLALVFGQFARYPVDSVLASRLGVWQGRFDLTALTLSAALAVAGLAAAAALAPVSASAGFWVRGQMAVVKAEIRSRIPRSDVDAAVEHPTAEAEADPR